MNLINHPIESLNAAKIITGISAENNLLLTDIEIFDTIDSTNTYLLAKAKKNPPSGLVCFAEQQTQGRGRYHRAWFSPQGNIYCSILWKFSAPHTLSGLSLAVGMMVAHALKKYGIHHPIQLKWPNDVLINQRKLAGILLERYQNTIVIGIGLNLILPQSSNIDWIALQEISAHPLSRNTLCGLLVNELLNGLFMYQTTGFHPFFLNWHAYDALREKKITIITPDKQITGVMKGIDEQGQLLLFDTNDHLQKFCYGEVSIKG